MEMAVHPEDEQAMIEAWQGLVFGLTCEACGDPVEAGLQGAACSSCRLSEGRVAGGFCGLRSREVTDREAAVEFARSVFQRLAAGESIPIPVRGHGVARPACEKLVSALLARGLRRDRLVTVQRRELWMTWLEVVMPRRDRVT